MVEDQEGAISDTGEACKEVPLRPSYKHPGREGLQLAWMAAEQEKAQPVRGERFHAALPQRQPGTLIRDCLCFFTED